MNETFVEPAGAGRHRRQRSDTWGTHMVMRNKPSDGTSRTSRTRRRRGLALLLATALPAGTLATVAAPPAIAQTTSTSDTEISEVLDLHSYPGFLTLAGQGVHYDTPSITGMVVTNEGYHEGHAPPVDQQEAVWATYGSSEPLPETGSLSSASAVAAGYEGSHGDDHASSDHGLKLATLHPRSDGGTDLRLSQPQRRGFARSSVETLSKLGDSPTRVAVVTTSGTQTPEALLLTGGPDGLRAYKPTSYMPLVATRTSDGLGAGLDIIDLHAIPRTDADCPTAHLSCNGLATVLYRDAGDANRDPGVVRATVSASEDASGSGYILGLANEKRFPIAGHVTHGQVRVLQLGSDSLFSTAVRVDRGDRQGNFLLEIHSNNVGAAQQGLCMGDGPPALAVYENVAADSWKRTVFACTAVMRRESGPDLLNTGVFHTQKMSTMDPDPVILSKAVPVPGMPRLSTTHAPVPLVDLPGLSAAKSLKLTRDAAGLPLSDEETKALNARSGLAVRSLLRGGTDAPDARVAVASVSWTQPGHDNYADAESPLVVTLPAADSQQANSPLLGIPLRLQRNTVKLELNTTATALDINSNPVPIAFLQAPPTVAGAKQGDGTSATYGTTTGTSSSEGTSTATRVGATLGLEWEDPSGAFGVEVEATYTREVEQSYESGKTIETTESYTGAPEQDNVVYRTDKLRRYTGKVVSSSLGVALGTDSQFDIPLGSVVSVASVPSLRARFAEFAPDGRWEPALKVAFPHKVGDPGSYQAYGQDGAVLDGYCDGTRSGGPTLRDVTPPAVYTPVNPFIDRAETPPGPDILIGERHSQVPGTGVIEGTDMVITKDQSQSFLSSHSFDVSAGFKAGYVEAHAHAGATWGTNWSSSLSTGQGFTAEIASIPSAELKNEGYDWRMFVCPKTLPGPGGSKFPAFIQGFLVDNYNGSGGLQELGPVHLIAPIESQVVDPAGAVLSFSQQLGSVEQYDYRIEAVGRNQVFTGTAATFASPDAGTPDGNGDGDGDGVDGRAFASSFPAPEGLLANQLYRWRVTATNFFGDTATSDYEFFTVDGPPAADISTADLTPDAGTRIVIDNNSRVTDLSDDVTCTWDFGDGSTLVHTGTGSCPASVEHTWTTSGSFNVTMTICASEGCSTDSLLITVAGTAKDDSYTVQEDSVNARGSLTSVLDNDGARFATLLQQTSHGALELFSDGTFRYVPDPDFCGTDAFSYFVDGDSTRSATARIDVVCVQDAPRPENDDYVVTEDVELVVDAPGVLVNDTDFDGTPEAPVVLRTTLAVAPGHGTVELAPDGSFRYRPARDHCGADQFRYDVSDGIDSVPATVHLVVTCVNDAPVAVADAATVEEDSTTLLPVTANDTDVDGDELTAAEVSLPANGIADSEGSGVRYQPTPDFCGTDTFTYRALDPSGALSEPITVSVTVTCVNDAPTATEDAFVRKAGGRPHKEAAPGVLGNDSDIDSTTLTAELHSPPHSGDVVLYADGSFAYTPNGSKQGGDEFYYRAHDGEHYSEPVRVVITVTQGRSGR